MSERRFSLLTRVVNPRRAAFEETVESVLAQTLTDWEWVLIDDDPTDDWVEPRLAELAAAHEQIRIVRPDRYEGPSSAWNAGLAQARGEFVGLLDPGELLDQVALERHLKGIEAAAADGELVDFSYSDHDTVSAKDGEVHARYLKPDWSPERLRHHLYTGRFALYRRELLDELGGFRSEFDGAEEHDLVLRVTEKARGILHVPEILLHHRPTKAPDIEPDEQQRRQAAGVRAVQEHLDRVGIEATASAGPLSYTYLVNRVPDVTTPVSVIIPTIGKSALIWGQTRMLVVDAVRSVMERTQHQALEFVIVYDPPTPHKVLAELRALAAELSVRIRLIEFREPFNFASKCNVGAVHAEGEILIFLNDDVEAVSEGVIENLVSPLREDGVGITGAKLLFENGLIQHAGVIYGAGLIHHSYFGTPGDDSGVYGELQINRDCSGVTGACLAIRAETFHAAGGFDERLPFNYNDVDLCNKTRAMGLRVLWLHDVVLYHFESISREAVLLPFEVAAMKDRWGDAEVLPERYANHIRHKAGKMSSFELGTRTAW